MTSTVTSHPGARQAALRVVCFPPAGGSKATFKPWRLGLPPEFAVEVVELPGRATRRGEAPVESLVGAAADLAAEVAGPQPYALVGHSLGGLLAYEMARHIDTTDLPGPEFVVVIGSRPPHRSSAAVFAPMLRNDDDGLLDALAATGAVNPVLRTSPLRNLFLPALRDDLGLIVDYHPDPFARPTKADLVAWHADGDPLAPPDLGREWDRYTSGRFTHQVFRGDHFFLYERLPEVIAALRALRPQTRVDRLSA